MSCRRETKCRSARTIFDRSWYNRAPSTWSDYWFSASDDEQRAPLPAAHRRSTKRWNSANMDLAGRTEYLRAKDDIFAHPDIKQAPWYVVDADDKSASA